MRSHRRELATGPRRGRLGAAFAIVVLVLAVAVAGAAANLRLLDTSAPPARRPLLVAPAAEFPPATVEARSTVRDATTTTTSTEGPHATPVPVTPAPLVGTDGGARPHEGRDEDDPGGDDRADD